MSGGDRLARRFAALRQEGRGGLGVFVTGGDPDRAASDAILSALPAAGADLIELGMPFSDPMADGPAIQAASQRALAAGASLASTLDQAARLRVGDADTPLILMGYYNPILARGVERFAADAAAAGADGVIIVDLPPEESPELAAPLRRNGLHLIALTAPTTDDARLPAVIGPASGFVYHVAVAGVTGTKSAGGTVIRDAVTRLRGHTGLPLAVGFGISTPEQAAAVAAVADMAIVGSAVVRIVEQCAAEGLAPADLAARVAAFVSSLASGVRAARRDAA